MVAVPKRRAKLWWGVGVAYAVIVGGLFVLALRWYFDATHLASPQGDRRFVEETVILTVLGLVLASAALAAAVIAARYAKPAFDDYRRQIIAPTVTFEITPFLVTGDLEPVPITTGEDGKETFLMTTDRGFLEVKIDNSGPATVRNSVFSIAAADVPILTEPHPGPANGHHMNVLPTYETLDNQRRRWLSTLAEGDLVPGNHHTFVVSFPRITPGLYPIVVTLDGEPGVNLRRELWLWY
jgi:hypothetical protein